jgi:cupin 2 domain-containing protein
VTTAPPIENLFAALPGDSREETITALLSAPNLRIERIVSNGQASPPGFWYDQDWAEWVILLTGSAELSFEEDTAPRHLRPGDYVHIPAHTRHRVEGTHASEPTVWLAVHYRTTEDR